MSHEISRRRFISTAAVTAAAAQVGLRALADASPPMTSPTSIPKIRPGTNSSFATLKQIDAGLLNVGYAEAGPTEGPSVLLLHGWPYDIHSFVDVTPALVSAGYRVVVPFVRGYRLRRQILGQVR